MKRTTLADSRPITRTQGEMMVNWGKNESLNLAAIFLEHSRGRIAVPDGSELEKLLYHAWENGRAPWPEVDLPADVFIRHLAVQMSKATEGFPLPSLLKQLDLAELYLACACVHRIPVAIEVLERHYLAYLPTLLAHLTHVAPMLDDVYQMVRIHLLMGKGDAGPQLDRFTGRGSLLNWIRVIAERMALRQGASIREVPEENIAAVVEDLPAVEQDVENKLVKRRFSREFRQALREGFATLSREQRDLIRLYFIEGLSTTALGLQLGLDQSTISRRLKGARQAIYKAAKHCLKERLGLSSCEFESHLKLIDSQVDLSFEKLVAEQD